MTPPHPPEDAASGDDDARDTDDRFAEIIAHFDEPSAPEPPQTSPVNPALPVTPTEPSAADAPVRDAGTAPDASGWRSHTPPADPDEDHFVPGPPAPLPVHDAVFWAALAGSVLGPLWFIWIVVTDPYGSRMSLWGAGLLTATGFALTVWRLPSREDRDEEDDGARV